MSPLFYIIIATLIISLGALVGIFTLSLNEKFLNKILMSLVGLSSGAMLGGAFIHLLPEGIEAYEDPANFFLIILIALITYLLIEKVLHWRHCHKHGQCETHKSLGYMNLVGDGVHNFIDGLIIAGTFIISIPLGITTTIAIALHEIPQEIGDFGVLLYSGFKKKKALILNYIVALMTVVGGIVGWMASFYIDHLSELLIPIAIGGFIYIATSDLWPELRKNSGLKKFLGNFTFVILGIVVMYVVKFLGE